MSLPHAILGVLADGPRHGRAVARALAHLLDGIRPANPGQVYATLGRLTRRGMIVARPTCDDHSARHAHGPTYALTPSGRAALRRWLGAAEVAAEAPCGFVARLLVLDALGDADGLARLLAVRRAQVTALHDALAARRRGRLPGGHPPAPDAAAAPLASLAREAARGLLAAELAWLDDARERLVGAHVPASRT